MGGVNSVSAQLETTTEVEPWTIGTSMNTPFNLNITQYFLLRFIKKNIKRILWPHFGLLFLKKNPQSNPSLSLVQFMRSIHFHSIILLSVHQENTILFSSPFSDHHSLSVKITIPNQSQRSFYSIARHTCIYYNYRNIHKFTLSKVLFDIMKIFVSSPFLTRNL